MDKPLPKSRHGSRFIPSSMTRMLRISVRVLRIMFTRQSLEWSISRGSGELKRFVSRTQFLLNADSAVADKGGSELGVSRE